ncbi:uncharacterized protein [Arachis hypogaea]|uniref:uncharacterized protein n=1 Tax=Arachis hypogaea TaxID=3818 RepID=UPI003B211580
MQGSSSQVAAEVGAEVNQGSPMKKISYKRKKVERKEKETEAAEDILGEKSVDLEQVLGIRLMCIGRSQKLKHARDSFDKASMAQLMQENVEKSSKLRDALDLVNTLQEKLTTCEKAKKELKEKNVALEARLVVLGVKKKQAETEKEDHGLEMFSAGFERVVEQGKFLAPAADLLKMDPCKVVIGDELVEDEDGVEGERENPDV